MLTHSKLRRICRQRLGQIARSVIGAPIGPNNSIRDARVSAFFRDKRIVLAAVCEKHPEMPIGEASQLAASIDMFANSAETVTWHWKPKGQNGVRPICEFGREQTIRHRIIAAAVDAQLQHPHPFFDRRGTGVAAAIQAIANAVREIGPYVLVADIADCFQSIEVQAIYELGILPPEVIRGALDYRHLPLARKEGIIRIQGSRHNEDAPYHNDILEPKLRGPRGLLHGSAASNAILRHLLSDLAHILGDDVRVIIYVDNIFVVGASEDVCGRAKDELVRHLANCRAGPLVLGRWEIAHAHEGFEALGYCLYGDRSGKMSVELSLKNLGKMEGWIAELSEYPMFDLNEITEWVLRPFPAVSEPFRSQVENEALLASISAGSRRHVELARRRN